MSLRTCITSTGVFRVGVHDPSYRVANLRESDHVVLLGSDERGRGVDNRRNFPESDVLVPKAARIYEIPNAFPFRGVTYIDSSWADAKARDVTSIKLPKPARCSFSRWLKEQAGACGEVSLAREEHCFASLPEPLLLALAAASTDPVDLRMLARISCELLCRPDTGEPFGLRYEEDGQGRMRPVIHRHDLFEVLVNNAALPDDLKRALVLRPGTQGDSEIIGDMADPDRQTHVFEYLRRNSYIPWGHYAANMADDAVRYAASDLSCADMRGLRHLYYQRTYVRLAEELGLVVPRRRRLSPDELERLRLAILAELEKGRTDGREWCFNATLWGWNFGFDFAPSGYRLHASHQQVHQQYALVPVKVSCLKGGAVSEASSMPAFACGDLVADVVRRYRSETGHGFFEDYLRALRGNRRTDGGPGSSSLIVFEDEHVLLFVPKAQTSGWEMQLLPLSPVGNILEADIACRAALDRAMLMAQRILEGLGARMVTGIEYSRRFDSQDKDQRLLYVFLSKLPYAPGGFSEAQSRYIVGHYPEDFAAACRRQMAEIGDEMAGDESRRPAVASQISRGGGSEPLNPTTMNLKETVYYLEMTDPAQLVLPKGRVEDLEIRKLGRPLPEVNRFFYQTIGKDWVWTERLPWDVDRWRAYLLQPGLETWLALHESTPAGYFELLPDARTGVEIVMFGLLAPFTGQGLGGHLLCFAVRRAWAMGTHRVWLHTSSLDHPCALAHYQARGFQLTHAEELTKVMPDSAPNSWGEYPGDPFLRGIFPSQAADDSET